MLGAFRGEPAISRRKLADVLEALGRLGVSRDDIRSIDVNPLIVAGDTPVVIDALVELEGDAR
jgi:succinyl-CoA synthetase beta subunit